MKDSKVQRHSGNVEKPTFGKRRFLWGPITERRFSSKPSELRLAELREMPYAEYLQTPEWAKLKKKVLRWARNRCERCGNTDLPLQPHHKTYERRGMERLNDLIVLCRDCHKKEHGIK